MIVRISMESDERGEGLAPKYKETWTIDRSNIRGEQYAVLHPTEGVVGHAPTFAEALQIAHDEIGKVYGADRQKWNSR